MLAEAGKGPCQPLNPQWDDDFMELLRSGQIWRADALDTAEVREAAGRGANEVLAWVAAFAAFSTGGHYTMEQEFYEAIPGWIAGMAMMAAQAGGHLALKRVQCESAGVRRGRVAEWHTRPTY